MPGPCSVGCVSKLLHAHIVELGHENVQGRHRAIAVIRRLADMGPEIFSLNVGGRKFTTSRETVCKVWREPSSPLEIASRGTYTR